MCALYAATIQRALAALLAPDPIRTDPRISPFDAIFPEARLMTFPLHLLVGVMDVCDCVCVEVSVRFCHARCAIHPVELCTLTL